MKRENIIKKRKQIRVKLRKLEKEQEDYYFCHSAFEDIEAQKDNLEKKYDMLTEKMKTKPKKT